MSEFTEDKGKDKTDNVIELPVDTPTDDDGTGGNEPVFGISVFMGTDGHPFTETVGNPALDQIESLLLQALRGVEATSIANRVTAALAPIFLSNAFGQAEKGYDNLAEALSDTKKNENNE